MTKRILVIGNGGREHALIEALSRSPQQPQIINFANALNPGIKDLCTEVIVGDYMNLEQVKAIGAQTKPDFAIVGPDDPIGIGAADALLEIGIPSFAPYKVCAQLESSKAFTRNLCHKHKIAGAHDFLVLNQNDTYAAQTFFDAHNGQIVVKADGLLGGKGVIVAGEHFDGFDEAMEFAAQSIEKFGRVVLEEKLIGEEFSLISLVDGTTVLDCPAIQDHKRAFEGDEGPNTGGMGCVSDENGSLPFLTSQDLAGAHAITESVMHAVKKETGETFVGVMYGGFMVTKNGVKLIEYNARFGDPEALNILPILETDFVDVCEKAIAGELNQIGKLQFKPLATVVKYLCPEGYPTDSVKNVPIKINSNDSPPAGGSGRGAENNLPEHCYFASVSLEDDQLMLKGSRAVGVLGTGKTMAEAKANCDAKLTQFEGPLFYRHDIGSPELMEKRLEHIKIIRG